MGTAKRFLPNPGDEAIAYYRYSSDAQRDESIDQQRIAAHDYAKSHGLRIIREYEDHAISGTRDDRAGYNLMLYEVKTLRPAALILWKTDRLSRDRIDVVMAKKVLRECGVRIHYVAEAVPDDDEATQILLESIYEGLAASFIASHRKNVLRGLTYNAERCLYNGVKLLGYTGEPGKGYKIDEQTAPVVRRIFEAYAGGTPMQQICRDLDQQGLRSIHGKPMTINSLRRILTNRSYLGVYKWGEYEVPDGMPRIIDDDLFDAVQQRMAANKRGGKGARRKIDPTADIADYWLSGHIYCGLCGDTMQGISGTSKSGVKHHYYSCAGHRRHVCASKNKPKDVIERIVLHVLDEIIHDRACRLMIAQRCYEEYQKQHDDGGAYVASIQARLHEAETKIENIMKAIEAGVLTPTTADRLRSLEADKSRLEDALAAERVRQTCRLQMDDIIRYLDSIAGDMTTSSKRRKVLDEFVNRIVVDDDTVTVILPYTEERRAFNIQETVSLLNNKQRILDMMDGSSNAEIPEKMLQSLINMGDDSPSFFP